MLTEARPQSSSLLIFEPFMMDPNFKRSVVFLAEHQEEGTIGYVLNQKSNLVLKDVVEDCPDADFPVYVGGPVAPDTLHFVHRCFDRMNSGQEVAKGIYWGGNFETLKVLVNRREIGEQDIRLFIGYSGWGYKQLEDELKENAWLVANSYTPDLIFSEEGNLWREVVTGLGARFAHIANFPENPMWN